MYKNHKVQPLHILLLEMSGYGQTYDGQTKWMYFLIEDDDIKRYNILFKIKSVRISKSNLMASLFTINNF